MKLANFRVTNFRSIKDSSAVTTGQITSLVGRNECGKSNLLLGLQALNPPGGPADLSPIKNFPRDLRLTECTENTQVVASTWELDLAEQAELTRLLPRASCVTRVEIGRYYKAPVRWVGFIGLKAIAFSPSDISKSSRAVAAAVEAAADKLDQTMQAQTKAGITKFFKDLEGFSQAMAWATSATVGLADFRKLLASTGIALAELEDGLLSELDALAAAIVADDLASQHARHWAASRLPVFVYVDEYPELDGHQNIAEYIARKAANQLTPADTNFEKMCKVAGLDPQQLHSLHTANDHETRNQIANRAGAVVTTELRRLWKDRPLKVRFSLDANHLDTFIADPNSIYDVEVNLNERSRGLKWFFSFYIAFTADTQGGSAENAILLLDEPGLHLHAVSQGDLLRHLATDFRNQIIYTTHSPFMVPTDNLDAIRTVNIDQESGTAVSNDPIGDPRTLFPLQMALGISLSQNLFIGPNNLVVEGVTDFWILSCASDYLHGKGRKGLPKTLTMTPAGGAQKIGYMVALLTSQRLNVLVLFDDEKQARGTKEELVKAKLIRDENMVFVGEGFSTANRPVESDVEDLLDAVVYDALVLDSYKKELKSKTLTLNAMVPRIVKRYEFAFADVGLEFHKTRPARLLLNKMATDPDKIMTAVTIERFERLFALISQAHAKIVARKAEPFH